MKIYYATQVEVAPPTIVLVVNNPDFVDESYKRFMINRFRELLPYPEVPIRLLIRPRGKGAAPPEGEALETATGPSKRRRAPKRSPRGAR